MEKLLQLNSKKSIQLKSEPRILIATFPKMDNKYMKRWWTSLATGNFTLTILGLYKATAPQSPPALPSERLSLCPVKSLTSYGAQLQFLCLQSKYLKDSEVR